MTAKRCGLSAKPPGSPMSYARKNDHEAKPTTPTPTPLGMRWTVERTNSWLSNYGQLRRNTDRRIQHRLAQICLAIALIITVKHS